MELGTTIALPVVNGIIEFTWLKLPAISKPKIVNKPCGDDTGWGLPGDPPVIQHLAQVLHPHHLMLLHYHQQKIH